MQLINEYLWCNKNIIKNGFIAFIAQIDQSLQQVTFDTAYHASRKCITFHFINWNPFLTPVDAHAFLKGFFCSAA